MWGSKDRGLGGTAHHIELEGGARLPPLAREERVDRRRIPKIETRCDSSHCWSEPATQFQLACWEGISSSQLDGVRLASFLLLGFQNLDRGAWVLVTGHSMFSPSARPPVRTARWKQLDGSD